MSTTLHRSSNSKPEHQSVFFRDLTSPISAHRSNRFATPGQAAAVSILSRENFSAAYDLPPPPIFTLEDRVDFTPEPALPELPTSPEPASNPRTPTPTRNYFSTPSSIKTRVTEGSGNGVIQHQQLQQSSSQGKSVNWWAPAMSEEKDKGSPVDGVVKSGAGAGALITFPTLREVARPEVKMNQLVPARDGLDEEEWVTVYGFPPGDTNLVLREFEKCGVILKHIPGPRDANWMHILYQNRYDAQKAVGKNGMQLNSILIIGVKPVDPVQRQYLNERLNSNIHGGFMVSLPPQSTAERSAALSSVAASLRLSNLQNGGTVAVNSGRHPTGAIASPAKSAVSKVMDLMFGF